VLVNPAVHQRRGVPCVYGNGTLIVIFTTPSHLSLSWNLWIYSTNTPPPPHFLKAHLNITFFFASAYSKLFFPFQIFHSNCLLFTCHVLRPSDISLLNYHNNRYFSPLAQQFKCKCTFVTLFHGNKFWPYYDHPEVECEYRYVYLLKCQLAWDLVPRNSCITYYPHVSSYVKSTNVR